MVSYPHRNNQWIILWMIVSTFVSCVKSDHSWKEEILRKRKCVKSIIARYDDQHEAPKWSTNVQVKKNDCMHNLFCHHLHASPPRIPDSLIVCYFRIAVFRVAPPHAACCTTCRCLMKSTYVDETSSNTLDNSSPSTSRTQSRAYARASTRRTILHRSRGNSVRRHRALRRRSRCVSSPFGWLLP